MQTFIRLQLAVVATILLASVTAAAADAPAKSLKGDAYYFSLGQMYDVQAYQHAKMLKRLSANGAAIPLDVLAEHLAAIRASVAAADKAYARLSAATMKKPETAKKLDEIKQFNMKILDLCKSLEKTEEREAQAAAVSSIQQHLTGAYQSAGNAASGQDLITEQWDSPGNGVFSD